MVKKEMGEEAVILRTRSILSQEDHLEKPARKIEITAAIDYDAPVFSSSHQNQSDIDPDHNKWRHMETELKEIKDLLFSAEAGKVLMPEIYFNQTLRTRYNNLSAFGLNGDIIRDLMKESHTDIQKNEGSKSDQLKKDLLKVISKIDINDSNKNTENRICSFIGPTGVGKTTTLAKLAAIKAVKQGKKTALITLDTFRMAAVSQLKTYAGIMGIPLEVALSGADIRTALQKHQDCDLILIDTAGRSPNNNQDIIELGRIFRNQENIHHYLVLSAVTGYRDLLQADKIFKVLPFKSYIFTKLDETQDTSSMINFLISQQHPVSYFTMGQQVPEDIEMPSKRRLAGLILSRAKGRAVHFGGKENKYGSGNWPQVYSGRE